MRGISIYRPQANWAFAAGDSNGYDPVDATAFYVGLFYAPTADPPTTAPTAASPLWPVIAAPCRIREVHLTIVVGGALGSAQTGSGYIRVGNGTDNLVFNNNLLWTGVSQTFSATGLSINLVKGDFVSLKIVPPTWVTEPKLTFYGAQVVLG